MMNNLQRILYAMDKIEELLEIPQIAENAYSQVYLTRKWLELQEEKRKELKN